MIKLNNTKLNGFRLHNSMSREGTAIAKAVAIAASNYSGVQGVQNAFTSVKMPYRS